MCPCLSVLALHPLYNIFNAFPCMMLCLFLSLSQSLLLLKVSSFYPSIHFLGFFLLRVTFSFATVAFWGVRLWVSIKRLETILVATDTM